MASDAEVFTGSLPRVLCECPHLDVNIFTPTIFHNIWNQNIGFYIFCNRLLQDIYKAQKLKNSIIENGAMPNEGLQQHTKATSRRVSFVTQNHRDREDKRKNLL